MKPWLPPDCSIRQALSVWSELEAAFYGENIFGGDTAEIYAYTLMPFDPTAHGRTWTTTTEPAPVAEVELLAARSLYSLLRLFEQERACKIHVEGRRLGPWLAKERFGHRIHVCVDPGNR